jgi:hypothetical protein
MLQQTDRRDAAENNLDKYRSGLMEYCKFCCRKRRQFCKYQGRAAAADW